MKKSLITLIMLGAGMAYANQSAMTINSAYWTHGNSGADVTERVKDECKKGRNNIYLCHFHPTADWLGDPAPGKLKWLTVDIKCDNDRHYPRVIGGLERLPMVLECPRKPFH